MSSITDALIYVEYSSSDIENRLQRALPFDNERNQCFHKIDINNAGGTKYFTPTIYAAAFNYVNQSDIEEWFETLPWSDADCAVLIVQYEHMDSPTVIRISNQSVQKIKGEI